MCGIISFHLNWTFTVKAILNGIPKSKKFMRYCHVAVNEGNLKGLLNFLDFLNRSDPYDRFFGLRTLFVCQFFRLGWDAFSTIQ